MLIKTIPKILTCSSLLVLAACSIPDDARSGLRALEEKGGLVSYKPGTFELSSSERVMFADPSQREEYALFRSGGAQLEVMLITTRHYHITNVALESWESLENLIEGWNHNQGRPIAYSDAFRLKTELADMQVKPFQLDGGKIQCAGFDAEWEPPGDDADQRPGKKLFGYFCEKPGVALPRTQIARRLTGLEIRGLNPDVSTEMVPVPGITAQPTQPELASRVAGNARSGTRKFPKLMAIFYQPNGGCDDLGC